MEDKLEFDNIRRYHFVLLGFAQHKEVLAKLNQNMPFYRITQMGEIDTKEVVYDDPDSVLTDSGVVISKHYDGDKTTLNVSKLSALQGNMKRPSKDYHLGEIGKETEPKDLSLEISTAIESAFNASFTSDLDGLVKQTRPKIEITIKGTRYKIICGSGYRASMVFENATYKDIASKLKTELAGVTLELPAGRNIPENDEILKVIDRYVNELALYNLSRYEIAKKLLYTRPEELETTEETSEEEE